MKFKSLQCFILCSIVLSNYLGAQGITISSGATFSLGSATLNLAANFENKGTFNPQNGKIVFNGPTGDQTYTDTTGAQINNFTINKASGDVLLGGDLNLTGTLTCTSGNLNLNGKIIYLGTSAILNESAGSVVKGTSGHIETTRTLNAPNNLNVAGLGAVITSAADLGSTKIIRKHNAQPTNSNGSILRYYDISPTNNSGLNATLTIYYDSNELNGLNENDLQLFNSNNNGSSWLRKGGTLDAANNNVTLSGIESLSLWTLSKNEIATISNAGGTINCGEGSSVQVFNSIFLNDPDDENIAGAVIQITTNYVINEDKLGFSDKNGIAGTWDNASATITLTGSSTKDAYVDAVRSVRYINSSSNATTSIRTISLTVNDGSSNSNTLTRDVSVTNVNNAPYLSTNKGATVEEGGSLVFNDTLLCADDIDDNNDLITYYVIEGPKHGELIFNNSSIETEESFSFTQKDIKDGKLEYLHNGDEAESDVFTFKLEGSSNEYSFTINITGVNDPPEVESLSNVIMKEDETYMLQLCLWYNNINDPDKNDTTFSFNVCCLNNKVCISAVSDTSFKITPDKNYFGLDTLHVVFKDSQNDSCCVTAILIIEPVNDMPEITGFPSSIEITKGKAESIEIINMLSDIETPDSLLKVSFDVDADSIFTSYSPATGKMNILSTGSFAGETGLTITVVDADGGKTSFKTSLQVSNYLTGIEKLTGLPSDYILYNNYPNPFNPSTKIRYGIPVLAGQSENSVQLKVYDVLGNEIATLVNGTQNAGFYEYTWDAVNKASGVYFYILTAKTKNNEFRQIRKMLLVK